MKDSNYKNFPNPYIDNIIGNSDDNYFTPVLNEVLSSIKTPSIICDIGCGNGIFSAALKKNDSSLIGIDGSEYALKKALEIGFDQVHLVKDLSLDILPINSQYSDLVICKDLLEHLLFPEHLISEINRITSPGGYLLLHVPNHFPIIGRLRMLFTNKIDTFNYFPNSDRWNFPHIRFFDKESLIKLALKYEFKMQSDHSWLFFRPARLIKIFPSLVKIFGNRYSNSTSEGFTILFKKDG